MATALSSCRGISAQAASRTASRNAARVTRRGALQIVATSKFEVGA